jgi:PPP family 3-phenylpropionic acid transporter
MVANSRYREFQRGGGSLPGAVGAGPGGAPHLDRGSPGNADGAADGFSWRLAAFYAAMFAFAGIVMPFFPVWLEAKGLDSRATGMVLAVPMFMRLVSVPLIARLADRWSAFRAALIAASIGSTLAYVLLSQVAGFVPILLAVALASIATAPGMPLTDAYALKGLGLRGRPYGPVRLWGSVAFVAANLGAGLVIDRIAPVNIVWLLVAALGIVAAVSLGLRPLVADPGRSQRFDQPKRKLLLSPGFWAITAAAALIQASHAVYYGFSVLDWRAKGLDATVIGGLWGLAVAAEIVLFAVSARLPHRISPLGLVGLGACGACVRWGAMSFDPPLALLPLLQLLHAFSFGATHLGSVQLLARIASDRQFATAQGDFATALALMMAGSMALSGVLYADLGERAYAAMALAAALGGSFALLARRFVREQLA